MTFPIRVIGRREAEAYLRWPAGTAIISITDRPCPGFPGSPPARLHIDGNVTALLRLRFNDLTPEAYYEAAAHDPACVGGYGDTWCMPRHAERIASMLRLVAAGGATRLVCHCEAGISRSAAVAAAASILLNGNEGIFAAPPYHPNSHVKCLVLRALGLVPA